MKRLKVFFFISSIDGGGAERVMVDIICHIDKSRIEPVLVLLYSTENSPYREYLPQDIRVIITKRKSDSLPEKIKQFIAFVRIVRRERPRSILSMLTHNNIMAILTGMLFKIKVFACEHSTLGEVIKTKDGKKMLGVPTSILVKALYKFASKVIAVSEGIKANLIEEFKISPEKIEVIYNPVDIDRIIKLSSMPAKNFFIENNAPLIIAMGRLTRIKGFDVLIKAFSRVVKEMDAQLIILGEGSERGSLKRLTVELGLTEKILLPGFQKNPYPFLSGADIFVLSSRYEGLPMAILEAMACGLPVIATDCKSGPREILQNGRCGLLVPVEDEAALAEGILKLLRDSALREKFATLGKKRTMDFSADKIVRRYENLFFDFIKEK
ncbi:MAG: glycosyltransferase [Nitrospirae bacterium]|nr:glycosyltransferase [Nitrospirota bacterium]